MTENHLNGIDASDKRNRVPAMQVKRLGIQTTGQDYKGRSTIK